MKKVITSILFAILIGAAAAFFRPATPYQVEAPAKPEFLTFGAESLLDNPNIAEDTNISPARKCGFCMGWAGQTACPGMCRFGGGRCQLWCGFSCLIVRRSLTLVL